MKFENAVEIHIDNVVLLGNKKDVKLQGYDNKFMQQCHWAYLRKEPNELICFYDRIVEDPSYRDELDKEIFSNNVLKISLKKIIYQELDRIFRININKFIEQNMYNISYFFEEKDSGYETITLFDMGKDLKNQKLYGIDRKITEILNNFEYRDIANGLIQLSTNTGKKHFIFDIKAKKFLDNEMEIFKEVYKIPTLKKFLAYEQYKNGITPPFYNEVAKINEFLEGKKTATLLFNDGTEKQIPAQISQILARNSKEFWINTQTNNMNINNLRAIRYGKKELIINTENLIEIDKQLNEFIDKNNELIIKNITETDMEWELDE